MKYLIGSGFWSEKPDVQIQC